MKIDRRGFLKSAIAAVVAPFVPKVVLPEPEYVPQPLDSNWGCSIGYSYDPRNPFAVSRWTDPSFLPRYEGDITVMSQELYEDVIRCLWTGGYRGGKSLNTLTKFRGLDDFIE